MKKNLVEIIRVLLFLLHWSQTYSNQPRMLFLWQFQKEHVRNVLNINFNKDHTHNSLKLNAKNK